MFRTYDNKYPTMARTQICNIEIGEWVTPDIYGMYTDAIHRKSYTFYANTLTTMLNRLESSNVSNCFIKTMEIIVKLGYISTDSLIIVKEP